MDKNSLNREIMGAIIARVIAKMQEAHREFRDHPDSEFYSGMEQANSETLDVIQSELSAFGLELSDYGIDFDLKELFA